MLLSTAYLPPVSYFTLLSRGMTLSRDSVSPSRVQIEACETYQKQSYRNRCYILASDGIQMLQVPVCHGGSDSIREIRIDYSTPWVVRTERALETAYYTSAFFEYYRDALFGILESGEPLLWDLNMKLTSWCAARCGIQATLEPTTEFAVPGTADDDFRYCLHPKKQPVTIQKPYYQVFRDRTGAFTPGLSILDLLFNEGPDSISYISEQLPINRD